VVDSGLICSAHVGAYHLCESVHLCWKKAVAVFRWHSDQLRIIEHIMAIFIDVIATKPKGKGHIGLLLELSRQQ
jgi:hypothetical protein